MMGTMTNTLILAFTGGSINTLVFILSLIHIFVSTISLSANENNFITEDKIDQISEDRREIKNEQWLKKFYKMMKSDDESSTLLNDIGSYEVWKTSILEDKTGEYELRLRAEDTVLRRFSIQQSDEDIDSDVDFDLSLIHI